MAAGLKGQSFSQGMSSLDTDSRYQTQKCGTLGSRRDLAKPHSIL